MDEPDDLKMLQVWAGTPVPNYCGGPPFPLNAVVAIVRLLWLLVRWLAHAIWAGFKWLRRFLGGERQVL